MRSVLPCISLALLTAVACKGGQADAASRSSVRDSAGIEIVENTQPGWTEAAAWRLSDAPTLDMGGTEGDSAHEFFRVAGVVRLSDGTIVVADNGTHELRFFGSDGTPGKRVGGKGAGPGEFQTLMSLDKLAGDSLLAYDPMNRRLTVFDAVGRHVRDMASSSPAAFVLFQIVGRLSDGKYLASTPNTRMGPEMLSRPPGPARDSVLVLRLDTAGMPADTLGTFPAGRVEVRQVEMLGRSFPMPVPVPFSPTTVVAAGPDAVYVGTTDTYEIRALSPAGELRRLIRRDVPSRPVTKTDQEEFTARLRDLPGGNAMMNPVMEQFRKAMSEIEYPETMPAYANLLVDTEGNLWVADHPGAKTIPTRWAVFTPEGRLLGMVTTPEGLQVREIGSDHVLGQKADDSEIEHVVLYQLIKPS
jgi:hypothetical protein